MYSEQIDQWGHKATDAMKQTRDLAYNAGKIANRNAQKMWKEWYPRVQKNLPERKEVTQSIQSFSADARDAVYEASDNLVHVLKHMQSVTLRLCAAYLGLKLFNARNVKLSEVGNAVETHVRTKPIESAVLALALGYLLGRHLR